MDITVSYTNGKRDRIQNVTYIDYRTEDTPGFFTIVQGDTGMQLINKEDVSRLNVQHKKEEKIKGDQNG